MPAFGIDAAAVSMGEYIPGDTVPASALTQGIKCTFSAPEELTELRLWAGDKIVSSETLSAGTTTVERTIDVAQYTTVPYLHLELRGKNSHLISNPFFLS